MAAAAGGGSRSRQGKAANAAVNEQLQKFMTDLSAAADMLRTASREMRDAADDVHRGSSGGYGPRGHDNQTRRPSHYHGSYPGTPGGQLGRLQDVARQRVAGAYNSKYGGDFRPSQIDPTTGRATHYHQYDAAGNRMTDHFGEGGVPAGEIKGALRHSRIAGALGEGGMMAGIRAIPYVGEAAMAAGAVYGGMKFIGSQRAANAQYQSIYGGTNMAGLGQRFNQQGYKLSQLFSGGLTGQMADQAFQGVSALGYQGGERQRRLNFASSNYKSMGMGVDESMNLIDINSKHAATSLSDLSKELRNVSDMAKQTGQNAAVMRASFTQNYQQAVQSGAGASSGAIAQGMTAITGGLGRNYQSANAGGLSTQTSMLMQANAMGMSYPQYLARGMQNSQVFAQGKQVMLNKAIDSISGNARPAIEAAIEAEGGAAKVKADQNLQSKIAAELMEKNILNPMVIQTILSGYGVDVSQMDPPTQAAYLVGLVAAGKTSITGDVAKTQAEHARRSLNDTEKQAMLPTLSSATGGSYGRGGGIQPPGGDRSKMLKGVAAWEYQNSTKDPALEALQKNYGMGLKLKFGDGKEVKLSDALKNSDYVNQIDQGTATLASGGKSDEGKTVGMLGLSSVGSQVGQTGQSTQVGGLTVTVNGNPDLLKALGLTVTQNPVVGAANSAGAPTKPTANNNSGGITGWGSYN